MGVPAPISVAWATQKGKRPKQEDRVINWTNGQISVFGVFDGHAGADISEALPGAFEQLGKRLTSALFRNEAAFKEYISANVVAIDEWLLRRFKQRAVDVGSTACLGFYDAATRIFYAMNLGDSRGVFMEMPLGTKPTVATTVMECTKDHKPAHAAEIQRIEAAGGHVESSGPTSSVPRVAGILAIARAYGDWSLKFPFNEGNAHWVGNVPDVVGPRYLDDPDKQYYLMFGSDGIFDMMRNFEIRNYTLRAASRGIDFQQELESLCKEIVKLAISRWQNTSGGDNCTCIIARVPGVTE